MVSDTARLPLRVEVASSSATRSSRSAQQSAPRSAASPAAGAMARKEKTAAAVSVGLEVIVRHNSPDPSLGTAANAARNGDCALDFNVFTQNAWARRPPWGREKPADSACASISALLRAEQSAQRRVAAGMQYNYGK